MVEISEFIILGTLFVIFGVFLLFDIFKRNEKYGYLAYIVAVIPVTYLWIINLVDILLVYTILFGLWIACILRDLLGIKKEDKDFDDVVLFLVLGIVIQLIITAILPSEQLNPELKENTALFWYFYLPDLFNPATNPTYALIFRLTATLLIFFVVIPLIVSIKGEKFPFIGVIIVTAVFIIPFLYLSYIWSPDLVGVLTFLFAVLLFIILLMITKSGKE